MGHKTVVWGERGLKMSVDLSSMPVGQGARFWSDYMTALKGGKDLNAERDDHVRTYYPSIMETIPPSHPHLRREFGQMESLILSQPRVRSLPTPVLGGVHDMVLRPGYMYCPVHTEVYGTYRARDARTEGTTL